MLVDLDNDTVLLGFEQRSPPQIWSAATGTKVRDFESIGKLCRSMLVLSMDRVAVGWVSGSYCIAVYNSKTGKRMQDLSRFGNHVVGLASVGDDLLTVCQDSTLRFWAMNALGQVCTVLRL